MVNEILDTAPDALPMPEVATSVLREASKPDTAAKDVSGLLKSDPALVARILKVANSAYYGLPRQVASIDDAVMLLGMRTIRNLVLTATMGGFGSKGVPGYGIGAGGLFKHALFVAQTAQTLSKETNKAIPAEAFTAGLLHDIGKVVLGQHVQAAVPAIVELAQNEECSFGEAERRVLGLSHAEVGGLLAEKWGLPMFLAEAIQSHHAMPSSTSREDITTLAATCIFANHVVRKTGSGVGINETADPELSGVVSEVLGVKESDFPQLEETLQATVEETVSILGGGKADAQK